MTMLKLLFKILQSLPAFQKLLSELFAAENAKLEKQLADYKLKALGDAVEIEKLEGTVGRWQQIAGQRLSEISKLNGEINAREIEIERLQNETQQRLKAVAAMDSEAVFDASLDRPGTDFTLKASNGTEPRGIGKIELPPARV